MALSIWLTQSHSCESLYTSCAPTERCNQFVFLTYCFFKWKEDCFPLSEKVTCKITHPFKACQSLLFQVKRTVIIIIPEVIAGQWINVLRIFELMVHATCMLWFNVPLGTIWYFLLFDIVIVIKIISPYTRERKIPNWTKGKIEPLQQCSLIVLTVSKQIIQWNFRPSFLHSFFFTSAKAGTMACVCFYFSIFSCQLEITSCDSRSLADQSNQQNESSYKH